MKEKINKEFKDVSSACDDNIKIISEDLVESDESSDIDIDNISACSDKEEEKNSKDWFMLWRRLLATSRVGKEFDERIITVKNTRKL